MDSLTPLDAENRPLLDIGGIFALLWRRKLLIAACFGTAVLLAMAYLAVTKPSYTAQAVILIDPREANTTSSPNVLGGIGADSAAIASQVAIISSTELLGTVFEPYKTDPEFAGGGLLSFLRGGISSPEQAFAKFRNRLGVEREGLTYVLNLTFTSSDPDKAAGIANAVAEQYISGQVAEKSGANSQVNTQLAGSIEQLRRQVAEAETAVEDYRTANNLFETGTGRTLLEGQVEQLNTQLSAAREAAREAANQYEQARSIGTSPQGLDRLSQFLSSGPAEELRNTYNLRVAELANARANFGPQHPTLVRLEAEVKHLSGLMRDEAARIIASLKAASELAESNVRRINDDLIRLQAQSAMSSQQSVELRQLERNADASRQVLEQFLARAEQVGQLDQLQRPDARIVSKAVAPLKPSWPRPSLVLGGAGLLGLLIGSMLALFTGRETPENRFAGNHRQIRRNPARTIANRSAPPKRRKSKSLPDLGTLYTRYQPPRQHSLSSEYLDAIRCEVMDHPHGNFAEDVNGLMQTLLNTMPTRECGLIFLTGFGDRLEKTRLAYALAIEMRHNGIEPLLLDLDPLAPTENRDRQQSRRQRFNARVDDETGVKVITAPAARHHRYASDENERIEDILYDHADAYDVVLIIAKPLTEPGAASALYTGAHHNIVVLNDAEDRQMAQSALAGLAHNMATPQIVTIAHGRQQVTAQPARAHHPRPGPKTEVAARLERPVPRADEHEQHDRISDAVEQLRRVVRRAAS
jgi:succinoglycan biosynthesis transport protein ExoP